MKRGVWLALLGPDGSGKSAVLDHLERLSSPSFAGTRRFHLRPHLGRRSPPPVVVDLHGRKPRSAAASWSKLVMWWIDYWTGYLLAVRPALHRRQLVLFDRYFDDILVDPRRYRYGGSRRLAEWLAQTIPRPDTIVVLDASVDVLRARKREVTAQETARQRGAYRLLAQSLPRAFVVDASRPLEEVVAEIGELIGLQVRGLQPCDG